MKRFISIILCLSMLIGITTINPVFATDAYETYHKKVAAINEKNPALQPQIKHLETGDGLCNVASATMLLNRRAALETNSGDLFTIFDFFEACKCENVKPVDKTDKYKTKYYSYSGDTGCYNDKTVTSSKNNAGYCVLTYKDFNHDGDEENSLRELLEEHIEGIMVYAPYNGGEHWIVLTECYKNGDSYTFYACDPVNVRDGKGIQKLTDTFMYKNKKGNYFNTITKIVYITDSSFCKHSDINNGVCPDCHAWQVKSTGKPDYTYGTIKNQYGKSTTPIYSAPYSENYFKKDTLKEGSLVTIKQKITNCLNNDWYQLDDGHYVYSKNVIKDNPDSTLTISTNKKSYSIKQGETCNVLGSVESNYTIKEVTAVLDNNGNSEWFKRTYTPNSNKFNIGDSTKINSFEGPKLCPGEHTLKITATDEKKTIEESLKITVQAATSSQPVVLAPTIEVIEDFYGGKKVKITQNTPGAELTYWKNDGQGNQKTSAGEISFDLNQSGWVTAYSTKSGKTASASGVNVIISKLDQPNINVRKTGSDAFISISSSDSLAEILVSTDGINFSRYYGEMKLTSNCNVYAKVQRKGFITSETTSQYVQFSIPNTPTIISPNENENYAKNQNITVKWKAVDYADVYDLDIYIDDLKSDLSVTDLNGTSYSVPLNSAGEYKFVVRAKNNIGISADSMSVAIISKEDVKVTFKDGMGNAISEQIIPYGSSAKVPSDPKLTGHYFRYWNGDYTNVTEDVEIIPVFEPLQYKVTFKDTNGKRIGNVQYVKYGESAIEPLKYFTVPAGYVFGGWFITAESAESQCDLNFVDSNITATAILNRVNAELPFVITNLSASRTDDKSSKYIVGVDVTNLEEIVKTSLLRVMLKTSDDKLVDTESRTIFLEPEATEHFSFTLNYSGTATVAEAVCLGYSDGNTGAAYSELVSCNNINIESQYVFGEWSEWADENLAPEDIGFDVEIQQREIYSSREKIYSPPLNTNSAPDDSWIYIGKNDTGNWTSPVYTGTSYPATSSDRKIQSEYHAATYKTVYNYKAWRYSSGGSNYVKRNSGTWDHLQTSYQLPTWLSKTGSGKYDFWPNGGNYRVYGYYNDSGSGSTLVWWRADQINEPADREDFVTQVETSPAYYTYSYCDKIYTYNFYKWGEWSEWSDVPVSKTDNLDVKTMTQYRYRVKNVQNVSIEELKAKEDKTGFEYSKIITLPSVYDDIDLNGRIAIVMAYKGKNSDPNESQLQYVGQTVIGENNTCDLNFITKSEPTFDTGDFTVCLSVQGATGLINIDTIEAEKELISVSYYDNEGTLLKEERVIDEGKSVPPEYSVDDGNTFLFWERQELDPSKISYVAKVLPKVFVATFVDWENDSIKTYSLNYGASLYELAQTITPARDGSTFLYWADENLEPLDGDAELLKNTIITAIYSKNEYTVKFYNYLGSIIDEQKVEYGNAANLPEIQSVDGKIFLGWNTNVEWWNVNCDMDVYPIFANEDTTLLYSNMGENSDSIENQLELYSNDDATIYYTIDGSIPNESDLQSSGGNTLIYDGPLYFEEDKTINAIAVSEDRNDSNVLEIYYNYNDEYDGLLDDLVKIRTYNVYVEPNQEIKVQVNIDKNPGLIGYLFAIECDRAYFFVDNSNEHACDLGSASSNGTIMCSKYGQTGWQVLWYAPESSKADGSLFTLTLTATDDIDPGMYPITISYSKQNVLCEEDLNNDFNELAIKVFGDDTTLMLGDVNMDGIISVMDVVLIARHIIDLESLTNNQKQAADVNGDGFITNADTIKLLRCIVGLEEMNAYEN